MEREPRLRFQLQPEGAVWSHVEATRSHLLIDPRAQARARTAGFIRPIELWRAPRWERPPSVAVVRYTEAGGVHPTDRLVDPAAPDPENSSENDVPPVIGNVVNRSSVVDFISDAADFRLGALGTLIDAVAAALDGGRPVVLAAPSAEVGAFWIGAVSFFASPATALQLSFSTQERLDDVVKDGVRPEPEPDENEDWRPPLISVVSEADVDRLSAGTDLPVVVVDPRVEATLEVVAGVEYHRTRLGDRIAVTDWSRLALDVCCEDPADLERCLRWLDEVSLAPTASDPEPGDEPGREHSVAWPLAAAVVFTDDLPLARPTATRVIRGESEPGAAGDPEPGTGNRRQLAGALESLVAATEGDAEPTWNRLQEALAEPDEQPGLDPRPGVPEALESYLRSALVDDSWLLRQAPPLPDDLPAGLPVQRLAHRLRTPLAAFVHRLTDELDGVEPTDEADAGEPADVRRGVLLLRGIDFAHRIAGLIGGPDLVTAGVGRLGSRAAEVLVDPEAGPRVAEIVGPLDGSALARWVVPALTQSSEPWLASVSPVGERLPAPVIALLARTVDPARLNTGSQVDTSVSQSVALEVAVASAAGRIAGDPRLRGPAVEYLLHQAADSYPDADPGPMVAEVFDRLRTDEPWPTAVLLRVIERAPATLGAELVPVVLTHLPHWIDDPLSARLAAALLKRIEFLPRLGGDGRPRPRRAGTTDSQAQLLNLLAATGPGWLQADDGLHHRAAEILMWADRAWPGIDEETRRLIAPRATVAAFQVALAAEPDQARTPLRSRLDVVPMGSAWRSAVAIGLEPALPLVLEVLRLNQYRLAGETAIVTTRAMLGRTGTDRPDETTPRLPMLPVEPVLRRLVEQEDRPELTEHLAALVEQELRLNPRPVDAAFWEFWTRALPGAPFHEPDPTPFPVLGEVLQVALGLPTGPAEYTSAGSLIESLIESPPPPAPNDADHAAWVATKIRAPAHRARPPWWRRWTPR